MIYEGSRYENEQVVRITDTAGRMHPAIFVRPDIDAQHFNFFTHVVQAGERIETIAFDYYGDPELWWIVARANPEVFYPGDLAVATVLRIPNG